MRQVKIGPQGIRGRVDDGLDLEQVIDLVSAFATWLGGSGTVIVVRDTRPSGAMLSSAVQAALSAAGCDVLDAGICPTAVGQFQAGCLNLDGLIGVTGAHNDVEWNGLKLYGPGGRVLSSAEGAEVLDLLHQDEFLRARHDGLGTIDKLEDPISRYVETLSASWVDRELIARAGLRVVVDGCNGAASVVVSELCEALGVELIPISCEPTGRFPHPPDPTKTNLAGVAAIVGPVGADLGFGLGSDCERLGLVTEDGKALGREATLPLMVQHLLGRGDAPKEPVVVMGATCDSRTRRVALRGGGRVVRCGVGVQAVIERMEMEAALVGGDNSGGVAVGRLHLAFDGLAALANLLEAVARAGDSMSLVAGLPEAHLRAATVPCGVSGSYRAVARVRDQAEGRVSDQDGVHVELDGGAWYHVRVSHTEPLIRIACESETSQMADELIAMLTSRVHGALYQG